MAAFQIFLSLKLLGALKGWSQTTAGQCLVAFWPCAHQKPSAACQVALECAQHTQCCTLTESAASLLCLQEALGSGEYAANLCAPTAGRIKMTLAQHRCKPATACREAVDSGEYAAAFWLCAQCCKSMEDLQRLKVSQQLNHTINKLYEDTLSRLEGALQVACADFQAESYQKASGTATEQRGALVALPFGTDASNDTTNTLNVSF